MTLSAGQLQYRVFEAGRRFATDIAIAADSIMQTTDSSSVRVRALRWKIYAVPLVQEASLRNDPLVAGVDLTALAVQQYDYFTSGDGRAMFAAQQPIAVNASKSLEQQAFDALDRATNGGQLPPKTRELIVSWAASHPIRGLEMERESILNSNWDAIGLSGTSLVAAAGSIDRTLQLITLRLSYMNESIGQRARWNASLLFDEALRAPHSDSMLLGGADLLRNMNSLTAEAPALVARERTALLAGVDRERALALADVDRQRRETLADLTQQRIALQAALSAERVAAFADIDRQRVAAMREADSLASSTISRVDAMARRVMLELLFVALATVIALTLGALLVVKRWRATAP